MVAYYGMPYLLLKMISAWSVDAGSDHHPYECLWVTGSGDSSKVRAPNS